MPRIASPAVGRNLGAGDAASRRAHDKRHSFAGTRLRSLRPRRRHAVLSGEKVSAGAGLGSGLLPYKVASAAIASRPNRSVYLCFFSMALPCRVEAEESAGWRGRDEHGWRGSAGAWKTFKPAWLTSSPRGSPALGGPPSPPAAPEPCRWGRCATDART